MAREKLITRTNADLAGGLCSGYLTYFSDHEGESLTEQHASDSLFTDLSNHRESVLFNTDYCAGFVDVLLGDRNLFAKE